MRHRRIEWASALVAATAAIDWVVRVFDLWNADYKGLWGSMAGLVAAGMARMSVDAVVMLLSAIVFLWARFGDRLRADPGALSAGSRAAAPTLAEFRPGGGESGIAERLAASERAIQEQASTIASLVPMRDLPAEMEESLRRLRDELGRAISEGRSAQRAEADALGEAVGRLEEQVASLEALVRREAAYGRSAYGFLYNQHVALPLLRQMIAGSLPSLPRPPRPAGGPPSLFGKQEGLSRMMQTGVLAGLREQGINQRNALKTHLARWGLGDLVTEVERRAAAEVERDAKRAGDAPDAQEMDLRLVEAEMRVFKEELPAIEAKLSAFKEVIDHDEPA